MSDAENMLPPNVVPNGEMSLVSHLQELRKRIIISVIAVAVSSTASYFYAGELMRYFTVPVGKLYYMNPAKASPRRGGNIHGPELVIRGH